MGSLAVWSMFLISYQTIICVAIGWAVLSCKCAPDPDELHEITLMKFLYLYDPQRCKRVYFYNVTNLGEDKVYGNVVWSTKNHIASSFRSKVQVWLSLHLLWSLFAIINVTHAESSCSFYATVVPFTLIGISLLVVDLVFASIFIIDAQYTETEVAIIGYVSQKGVLRAINKRPLSPRQKNPTDTSWIAMLLAFVSLRGIVQWIINFWIVKDNYFEGLKRFRHQQYIKSSKTKLRL